MDINILVLLCFRHLFFSKGVSPIVHLKAKHDKVTNDKEYNLFHASNLSTSYSYQSHFMNSSHDMHILDSTCGSLFGSQVNLQGVQMLFPIQTCKLKVNHHAIVSQGQYHLILRRSTKFHEGIKRVVSLCFLVCTRLC